MNIMPMKNLQPASAPINSADVLAVLDRRLTGLRDRDAVLLKTQILLEKTSATARNDAGANAEQAQAMLEGIPFVASRDKPMSQLAAVIAERDIIALALKIGSSERHRVAVERAAEIWASFFPQIAEMEKRRVLLVLELQRTNRAREKLREKIASAGGAGFLTTDSAELLGLGDSEEVKWSIERVVADGICTRREIEKAARDD